MAFWLWKLKPVTGKKKHHLIELYTWACDTVMWHWSVDTFLTAVNWT